LTKSFATRLLYRARNLLYADIFDALRAYCEGQVLDVGGWDFVETAISRGIHFEHWVTLERTVGRLPGKSNGSVSVVYGDGCALGIASNRFDTVVNIQVLEHVFEPILMVEEIGRVLRPGGYAIFLIPQTSTMHLAPHFHQNFSRFWIQKAMERAGLELVQLRPLGGVWSSMASHLLYFFFQAARADGMSDKSISRKRSFWILLPLQALYAAVSIPICMLFSLGDLEEEPNNHLVVAQKPAWPMDSTY
jgi:SAM-dependent methyltransferase